MTAKLTTSQKILLLPAIVLVAVAVALVYFYFEAAVHHSINYVWDTLLDTETKRLLVVPTTIILGLVYFGAQHRFDRASEGHESHGLGSAPSPTLVNLAKVLGVGFLSLVAGASLGPEAILVPASLIVGQYIGVKVYKKEQTIVKMLGMVGFIALFAAFFDSFWAGILGLLLVSKQVKLKLNSVLVAIAALASAVTVLVLSVLSSSPYTNLPQSHHEITISHLLLMAGLLLSGFAFTYLLARSHDVFEILQMRLKKHNWWIHGLVAGAGLSAIYLLGGYLVQFTGNESIVPMLEKASSLGVAGLLWLFVMKILAISWSKALGYRGGMVFPTIFAASVVVAIAQQVDASTSFIIGLIIFMTGAIFADRKEKILL